MSYGGGFLPPPPSGPGHRHGGGGMPMGSPPNSNPPSQYHFQGYDAPIAYNNNPHPHPPATSHSLPPLPRMPPPPQQNLQPYGSQPALSSPNVNYFYSKIQHLPTSDVLAVLTAAQEAGLSLESAIEALRKRMSEEKRGTHTTVFQEGDEITVVRETSRKNYQPGLYFGGPSNVPQVKKSNPPPASSGFPPPSSGIAKGSGPPAKIALPPLPSKPTTKSSSPTPHPSLPGRYEEEGSRFVPQEQSETLAMLTEEKFIYHHVRGPVGNIAPVGMEGVRFVDDCLEFYEDGTYIFEKYEGSEGREEFNRLLMRWRGTFNIDPKAKRTVVLRWDTYDMNIDTSYNSKELSELSHRYGRLTVGADRTLRTPVDPSAIFV